MKFHKKLFICLAILLCFSFCMGSVSNAETIKQYKETKYSCPVKNLSRVEGVNLDIDRSGKINFSIYDGRNFFVTYNSNGKRSIKKSSVYSSDVRDMKIYGGKTYRLDGKKLCMYNNKGKKIKQIKLNENKYSKSKTDRIKFFMVEVRNKNVIRVGYSSRSRKNRYGGMIDVNISSGKIKKVISTDFAIGTHRHYDGKYIYDFLESKKGTTFYCKSLKTKKTKKFKAEKIVFDKEKYSYSTIRYAFYNGNIMAVEPGGKVYFGNFDDKKLEQIGDISECKNFTKYNNWGLAMKSKNEFYILYSPAVERGEEGSSSFGDAFIAKYKANS